MHNAIQCSTPDLLGEIHSGSLVILQAKPRLTEETQLYVDCGMKRVTKQTTDTSHRGGCLIATAAIAFSHT